MKYFLEALRQLPCPVYVIYSPNLSPPSLLRLTPPYYNHTLSIETDLCLCKTLTQRKDSRQMCNFAPVKIYRSYVVHAVFTCTMFSNVTI
jgi:hypothetical protein